MEKPPGNEERSLRSSPSLAISSATSSGIYLVPLTLLTPVLIGVAALGTEGASILSLHRQVQAAADSAAVSVASYYAAQKTNNASATTTQLTGEAQAVAASYGFVTGTNGATVTMNTPPASGNFTTDNYAFEVIVTQTHSPLLSSYLLPNAMTITARAVALVSTSSSGGGSNAYLHAGAGQFFGRKREPCGGDLGQRQRPPQSAGMQHRHQFERKRGRFRGRDLFWSEGLGRDQFNRKQRYSRRACQRSRRRQHRRQRRQHSRKLHQRFGLDLQRLPDSHPGHGGRGNARPQLGRDNSFCHRVKLLQSFHAC